MQHSARSHAYQLFMLALCVYTLGALAVHSLFHLEATTVQILEYADVGICMLFLVDFGHSLWRAEAKWKYLYTWGWLDLASSIPMLPGLRFARIARVARIFRVLRGVRATRLLASFVIDRRAESAFLAAALVSLLLLVFSSISVLQFENTPEANIKTAADAVWWATTTITTVGYGDRFPVTPEGRLVGGLLMITGVGLFGTLSGFIAAWFLAPKELQARHQADDLAKEVRELRLQVGLLVAQGGGSTERA